MGAGILPATFLKGSIIFLLGKEKNNLWSDFGGSSNIYESGFDTAIREGYEELDGFFGNKNDFENLVKDNLISLYCTKRYSTFLFYMEPETLCNIPYYFNNHRKFLENELNINNIRQDGLFEKTELKLFTKKDILLNYQNIRPFYKEIIHELLNISEKDLQKFIVK